MNHEKKKYIHQLKEFFNQFKKSKTKFFKEKDIWFDGRPKLPDYGMQRENLFNFEEGSGRETNSLGDHIYAVQDALALRYFTENLKKTDRTETFIDVASSALSMTFFSQFAYGYYVDPRPLYPPSAIGIAATLGLSWVHAEGQDLVDVFGEDFTSMVTSLHAPEHFGLGRYGDKIDYDGTLKFMRSVNKVLKGDGTFIMSTPYSWQPRIEFHNARVFDMKTMLKQVTESGFEIDKLAIITPSDYCIFNQNGGINKHPSVGLRYFLDNRVNTPQDKRWCSGRTRHLDWFTGAQKDEDIPQLLSLRKKEIYSTHGDAPKLDLTKEGSDALQFAGHFELLPPEDKSEQSMSAWAEEIDSNAKEFFEWSSNNLPTLQTSLDHHCMLLVLRKP